MGTVNIVSFMGIVYILFGVWVGYIMLLAVQCMRKYLKPL